MRSTSRIPAIAPITIPAMAPADKPFFFPTPTTAAGDVAGDNRGVVVETLEGLGLEDIVDLGIKFDVERLVPVPKMVVEPIVVVRVEEPEVSTETMRTVVIGKCPTDDPAPAVLVEVLVAEVMVLLPVAGLEQSRPANVTPSVVHKLAIYVIADAWSAASQTVGMQQARLDLKDALEHMQVISRELQLVVVMALERQDCCVINQLYRQVKDSE